jgi:hypothetical protein
MRLAPSASFRNISSHTSGWLAFLGGATPTAERGQEHAHVSALFHAWPNLTTTLLRASPGDLMGRKI